MKRAAPSNGQRRQRPRSSQPVGSQPDLPEIPGVPPDLTPLMVESLKSATKFFHSVLTPLNPFQDDEESIRSTSQPQQATVVDSILNRMSSSEEEKKRRKLKECMDKDRQSLLDALKRKRGVNDGKSVPVSCFRYLWELGQEHCRVAARRASLYLCGALLQKSSECRRELARDDTLLKFVTCVVVAQNLKANTDQPVSCWQAEALEWLSHLSEEHGNFYPKFRVARSYLEQRCSSSLHTIKTNSTMPDIRRLRDIAIKYGDREIEKVEKLIQRANECLEVLVPRMGDAPCGIAARTVTAVSSITDIKEDDDDDIEWEDGDEEIPEDLADDHARAVERTLEVMGLQGGIMEINFARNCESDDSNDEDARKVLQKTAQSIESRHMKRLSSWVDALIRADGLVMNGKSLVVMSVDESRKRGELLQRLIDVKQSLASILASTSRFGISVDAGDMNDPAPYSAAPTSASNLLASQRQRAVLAPAARCRSDKKVTGRHSTKLQIRYRKS